MSHSITNSTSFQTARLNISHDQNYKNKISQSSLIYSSSTLKLYIQRTHANFEFRITSTILFTIIQVSSTETLNVTCRRRNTRRHTSSHIFKSQQRVTLVLRVHVHVEKNSIHSVSPQRRCEHSSFFGWNVHRIEPLLSIPFYLTIK